MGEPAGMRMKTILAVACLSLAATACNGSVNNQALPGLSPQQNPAALFTGHRHRSDPTSLLKTLKKQIAIGSTVDAKNKDKDPMGLAIVATTPPSPGKLAKGDLLACNFSSKTKSGAGTTIELLKPAAGSKPVRFAQDAKLGGCDSLSIDGNGNPWAAAATAKQVSQLNTSGKIGTPVTGAGIPYGVETGCNEVPCYFYATQVAWSGDVSTGSVLLDATCQSGCTYPKTKIFAKFPTAQRSGRSLGPTGIAYDPQFTMKSSQSIASLYVVDGAINTVIAVGGACGKTYSITSIINANSLIVKYAGGKTTFTGKLAPYACVVSSGGKLNAPVSVAVLPNHNILVANSGDNNLVEIETTMPGKQIGWRNVDRGAAGALGGIAAIGTSDATTKIYFTDGNANSVMALQK
jgi:hypothetical protein